VKVFFDTNIILDYLQARENFYDDAKVLYSEVEQRRLVGLLSATSLTNVSYIVEFHLRKVRNQTIRVSKLGARFAVHRLINTFEIAPVGGAICGEADASEFTDYEDAVQYFCANQSMATHIVTRNKSDFATVASRSIKICDPRELRVILGL
jgi:predicted nucleic acid-binding protein